MHLIFLRKELNNIQIFIIFNKNYHLLSKINK